MCLQSNNKPEEGLSFIDIFLVSILWRVSNNWLQTLNELHTNLYVDNTFQNDKNLKMFLVFNVRYLLCSIFVQRKVILITCFFLFIKLHSIEIPPARQGSTKTVIPLLILRPPTCPCCVLLCPPGCVRSVPGLGVKSIPVRVSSERGEDLGSKAGPADRGRR